MSNYGRIPCQPLEYENISQAQKKELIVDYDSGDIYVMKEDFTLLEITKPIREAMNNFDGDTIQITVNGIGKLLLNEVLYTAISKFDNAVEVDQIGDNSLEYYKKSDKLDNVSIESLDQNIQIKGFDKANDLSIIRKKNGKLEFITIVDILQEGINQAKQLNDLSALDGKIYDVPEKYGHNYKIYLEMNKRQKTINPPETELNIILPTIVDEYAKVEWLVSFGNNASTINLPSNVKMEITPTFTYPAANNNTFIYTFETYDFGGIWLCSKRMFPGTYDLSIHEPES